MGTRINVDALAEVNRIFEVKDLIDDAMEAVRRQIKAHERSVALAQKELNELEKLHQLVEELHRGIHALAFPKEEGVSE